MLLVEPLHELAICLNVTQINGVVHEQSVFQDLKPYFPLLKIWRANQFDLPVQIFLWADSPERAFIEKTSAAIMVLLTFLIIMNTSAVWLRKRLERRW